VLDGALKAAADSGVNSEGEILEGSPRRRIAEFAGDRGAQLVVVGSRRHKLGRSVSCGVVRGADRRSSLRTVSAGCHPPRRRSDCGHDGALRERLTAAGSR
jgi:nucleotide-binding universal stress UspA family protein